MYRHWTMTRIGPRVKTVMESLGYLSASLVALIIDLGIFTALVRLGSSGYVAAAVGFLAGTVVSYYISVRFVFAERTMRSRWIEMATFALIGCFGLLVVQVVMWVCISQIDLQVGDARLVAVAFSFASNFLLRKLILFRSKQRDQDLGEGEGEVA